jgi:hypothetical protein
MSQTFTANYFWRELGVATGPDVLKLERRRLWTALLQTPHDMEPARGEFVGRRVLVPALTAFRFWSNLSVARCWPAVGAQRRS